MRVLLPIDVTEAMVTASNLAENDHGEWMASVDYSLGDFVISTATHQVYRALQPSGPNPNAYEHWDNATDYVTGDRVFVLSTLTLSHIHI